MREEPAQEVWNSLAIYRARPTKKATPIVSANSIVPTTTQKLIATAVLVLKTVIATAVGKLCIAALVGQWPEHQVWIERVVIIAVLGPLLLWGFKPFSEAIGLGKGKR